MLVLVAGAAYLIARGGGDDARPAATGDPLAAALAYAPTDAEVVATVDAAPGSPQGRAMRDLERTFPAGRFAADAGRSAITAMGFDPQRDAPKLLAGPIVLAGPNAAISKVVGSATALRLDVGAVLAAGAIGSFAGRSEGDVAEVVERSVKEGKLRPLADVQPGVKQYALPGDAGRLGVRGRDVVLANTSARLAQAFALRDRHGGLTRRAFEARLGPLTGPALAKLVAQPRVLIGDAARDVPWVRALRYGAVSVAIEPDGLRLRAHLTTDPTQLRPEDLPLAPGAAPPSPAPGAAKLAVGVRDLGQTIRVLDAVKDDLKISLLDPVTSALRTLDRFKGPLKTFGRIDVDAALIDQLTGTTTITQEANGIGVRGELRDGGPLRTALNRIASVPDFLIDLANITDLDLDKSGDEAYVVKQKGKVILRLAVLDNLLVATTDPKVGLRAIANRRPQRASREGALAFRARGTAVQDLIISTFGLPDVARLFVAGFGDFAGSARAELSGLDVDSLLALRR